MKFLIWLLLTIQFRSLNAYPKYVVEQKRRQEESESPFEKTWVFWFQRKSWGIVHWMATGLWPIEVIHMYWDVFESLYGRPQTEPRLSGQTLLLGEYAINPSESGIYVHKKKQEAVWELVYRTNWLMDDLGFLSGLSLFAARGTKAKGIGIDLIEQNSGASTVVAVPN